MNPSLTALNPSLTALTHSLTALTPSPTALTPSMAALTASLNALKTESGRDAQLRGAAEHQDPPGVRPSMMMSSYNGPPMMMPFPKGPPMILTSCKAPPMISSYKCEDPRPHAWSLCAACMLLSLYFPVTCNPSRAVTIPNMKVSQ